MSVQILPSLLPKLAHAYQILETVVLRTSDGTVYTVEVGQPIMEENSLIGAKVTMVSANRQVHIGTCEAETIELTVTAAQELVAQNIASGKHKSAAA